MELFTRTEQKYRDFSLVVNVPRTALGFSKSDQIVFREYSPGDPLPVHSILAVSKPMEQQLEIGQYLLFRDPTTKASIAKIRLWNDSIGWFFRDFDIHGVMIRPTLESWKARRFQLPPRCCAFESPGTLCDSPGIPCTPSCPHLSYIPPFSKADNEWIGYKTCKWFTRHDYLLPGTGDTAECCLKYAGMKYCRQKCSAAAKINRANDDSK
ncbi:MAG: hypothetical protein HQM09_19410 [Candidatus Riflebacteria bacterium]|nr:hypothetical protein [Candidatus Riflebacteria bacterium]